MFGALLTLFFQRVTTDELTIFRLPGDGPAHVGGQRRNTFIHLLAIQVHASFQTQRVTRAQPGWLNACRQQLLPEIRRLLFRQGDFITRFAGITGGGDKQIPCLHAEERLHAFNRVFLFRGE
ncbi:hypothetical protein D3C76_1297520 [compost metagenome]